MSTITIAQTTMTNNHGWQEFQNKIAEYAQNRYDNATSRTAEKATLVELKDTVPANAMQVYLSHIENEHGDVDMQHYNCNACREFMDTLGSVYIASVDLSNGAVKLRSLLWSLSDSQIETLPIYFKNVAIALRKRYEESAANCKSIQPFFYSRKKWKGDMFGHPEKGGRFHFHMPIPKYIKTRHSYAGDVNVPLNYFDASVSYVNDAINKYGIGAFKRVTELLSSDAVKAEKGHLVALKMYLTYEMIRGKDRIAAAFMLIHAPTDMAHINGGVVGQILDDVLEGKDNDQIIAHYKTLTRSDLYMRPTKEADEGNIEQANKLIAELGLESALRRRAARLDEVIQHAIWFEPVIEMKPDEEKSQGAFDKLRKKKAANISPAISEIKTKVDISWAKFVKDILPVAETVKVVLALNNRYPLCQYVTAADPDAKPIHKWDKEDNRNPFSQYVYTSGSYPREFYSNLVGQIGYADFDVVAVLPDLLSFNRSGQDVDTNCAGLVVVRDMRDLRNTQSALFPACLIGALHPVRATVERYSNTTPLEKDPADDVENGEYTQKVCGLMVAKESKLQYHLDGSGIIVKVKKKGSTLVTTYNIHSTGE